MFSILRAIHRIERISLRLDAQRERDRFICHKMLVRVGINDLLDYDVEGRLLPVQRPIKVERRDGESVPKFWSRVHDQLKCIQFVRRDMPTYIGGRDAAYAIEQVATHTEQSAVQIDRLLRHHDKIEDDLKEIKKTDVTTDAKIAELSKMIKEKDEQIKDKDDKIAVLDDRMNKMHEAVVKIGTLLKKKKGKKVFPRGRRSRI